MSVKEVLCWIALICVAVAFATHGEGWQAPLAWTLSVFAVLAFALCRFAKWHKARFLRIPNSEINAHKITPRFSVGSDVK